ncbi:hypothetical protein B0H13DRAFT_1872298 [Mycena leptocephala]|nr:hypothetical protein B0H13DRAFT_1872298 [Mycena leptocephala]
MSSAPSQTNGGANNMMGSAKEMVGGAVGSDSMERDGKEQHAEIMGNTTKEASGKNPPDCSDVFSLPFVSCGSLVSLHLADKDGYLSRIQLQYAFGSATGSGAWVCTRSIPGKFTKKVAAWDKIHKNTKTSTPRCTQNWQPRESSKKVTLGFDRNVAT